MNALMKSPDTKHVVSIQVPSTNNVCINGKKVTIPANENVRTLICKHVATILASRFGGVTTVETNGAWIDAHTKELVWERGTRIETLIADITAADLTLVASLASVVKTVFNQDAVLVKIDNMGWFI